MTYQRIRIGLAMTLLASSAVLADWIDFESSSDSVNEAVGDATLVLVRTAPSAEPATVYVALADITSSSADYGFSPGNIDPTFSILPMTYQSTVGTIDWLFEDSTGRIVAGGALDTVSGNAVPCVNRFLADGTLDTTYSINLPNNACHSRAAHLLSDDRLLVSASYTDAQSQIQIYLVRLNNDGNLDQTFAELRPDRSILAVDANPSGKPFVSGTFALVNGVVRAAVARANVDGTLDLSFDTGLPESWRGTAFVWTLKALPDGKVLVGGQFDTWGALSTPNAILRLSGDGSVDNTFTASSSSSFGSVYDIELLPSGRLLVAHGDGVAMLESNGDPVPSFQVQTVGAIEDISIQDNGKILLTGSISEVNGQPVASVARLHSDGTLDTVFDAGSGAVSTPMKSHELPSGTILVGGNWTSFGGSNEPGGLIRLQGSLRANWDSNQGGAKTLLLPILDDLIYEGNEELNATVESVIGSGVEIGAVNVELLTIVDNDPYVSTAIGSLSTRSGDTISWDLSTGFVHPDSDTLSFSAAGLPSGLSISSAGALAGATSQTADQNSPYSVTVTATDSAGAIAQDSFQLIVAPAPAPPSSGGGGSTGIVLLVALFFAISRRRPLVRLV